MLPANAWWVRRTTDAREYTTRPAADSTHRAAQAVCRASRRVAAPTGRAGRLVRGRVLAHNPPRARVLPAAKGVAAERGDVACGSTCSISAGWTSTGA